MRSQFCRKYFKINLDIIRDRTDDNEEFQRLLKNLGPKHVTKDMVPNQKTEK